MYQEIIQESKDMIVFKFAAENKEAIETKVIGQFQKDGYKKLGNSSALLTFEKGSYVGRILLGAFYKYYKWDVRIEQESDFYKLTLNRQSSGMSGGVIGMNQVKNELLRLKGVMSNWN